jgi:hypothetical protein
MGPGAPPGQASKARHRFYRRAMDSLEMDPSNRLFEKMFHVEHFPEIRRQCHWAGETFYRR